jgi:hypothetical protein
MDRLDQFKFLALQRFADRDALDWDAMGPAGGGVAPAACQQLADDAETIRRHSSSPPLRNRRACC